MLISVCSQGQTSRRPSFQHSLRGLADLTLVWGLLRALGLDLAFAAGFAGGVLAVAASAGGLTGLAAAVVDTGGVSFGTGDACVGAGVVAAGLTSRIGSAGCAVAG